MIVWVTTITLLHTTPTYGDVITRTTEYQYNTEARCNEQRKYNDNLAGLLGILYETKNVSVQHCEKVIKLENTAQTK